VKYQYKQVPSSDDLSTLNALGQAGWEVVGILPGEKNNLLLSRDSDLPVIRDGLEDHPIGTILASIVVEPQDTLRLNMRDTMKHLNNMRGNGLSNDVKPAPNDSIISKNEFNGGSKTFLLTNSGFMRWSRIDVIPQNIVLTIDDKFFSWLQERMKLFAKVLEQCHYAGNVYSVLTISGIKEQKLKSSNYDDTVVISLPYVQVSYTESAQLLSENGDSPILNRLVEYFYWSLGIDKMVSLD